MNSLTPHPDVFFLRNRLILLVVSPLVTLFSLAKVVAAAECNGPSLNWIANTLLWLLVLVGGIRTRLVFSDEGIEYTQLFKTVRYRWSRITGTSARKVLGVWPVDGLTVVEDLPYPHDGFVDLLQFDKAWRSGPIGARLRRRMPDLFD